MVATGLIDRHVAFVEALRGAGLPVSLVESLDAARAMATVDLLDREQLRAAYAATSVKHAAHRATFDRLFDLWWPPGSASLNRLAAVAASPATRRGTSSRS